MGSHIYVASKAKHGPMWVDLRDRDRFPIEASWLDHDGEADSDLWLSIVDEVANAGAVVAYHEPGEQWKGAYLEVGIALGAKIPVFVVGDPGGSWQHHPLVRRVDSVESGLRAAQTSIALRNGLHGSETNR